MDTNSQRRRELRPQGFPSPACTSCQWFKDCGGFQSARSLSNCFDETCCEFTGKDKSGCNAVCPYKEDFNEWLLDTNGLRFDDLPTITQPDLNLPLYIPVVDHCSRRREPLEWPIVALNTYNVLRMPRGRSPAYRTIADDPEGLRAAFRLGINTKIILRGIGADPQLERYWENRLEVNAPDQLFRLQIAAAIGPNFSHFLNVPRTDNLYNRRRQLVCLEELRDAGLNVAPHLSATMPGDWRFWHGLLNRNPSLRYVAFEFQTGNKNRGQGKKAIDHLADLQRKLNRPLHPILVGGAQFVEFVAIRFQKFTIIDSTPFAKAMRRQIFDQSKGTHPWDQGYKLIGQSVDDYLLGNISGYAGWLEERAQAARSNFSLN